MRKSRLRDAMWRHPVGWVLAVTGIISGLVVAATASEDISGAPSDAARASRVPDRAATFHVSAVSGVAWLNHLGISFDTTSMGRMGQNTPPASVKYEPKWNVLAGAEDLNRPFVLSGSDLYRLNCESCHQPDGHGSPPEIHSLIEPVQAMSASVLEDRMKARGAPITAAMARELARGAEAAIRTRLLKGGQKMPPFEHLDAAEVNSLLAFLRQLAGVPGAQKEQLEVVEPYLRTGEHLVKGTCHICHDATGPGIDPEALLRDRLPSLASLPRDKSVYQVIQKVRHGAPVAMGALHQMSGGRMPVFSYLTDDEVAAAYVYLVVYPPRK